MMPHNQADRRFFLQTAGLGAAGMALSGVGIAGLAKAAAIAPPRKR